MKGGTGTFGSSTQRKVRALVSVMMCGFIALEQSPAAFAATAPVPTQTPTPNIGLLRHVDATDFLWYANPTTNQRYFIGSNADAEQVIRKIARTVQPLELANLSPRVSPGIVAPDADQDGLPDSFEALIGSNPQLTDSDGDSYPDGVEVKNGYSPILGKGAKLVSNAKLAAKWPGQILQSGTEYWYVNPADNLRYYLGGLQNIMQAMFALTKPLNGELALIPVAKDSPLWLNLPAGYSASIVDSGLIYPRALALDPAGHLVASQLSRTGEIVGWNENGERVTILKDLDMPHGVVFAQGRIYVARETAIEYWPYDERTMQVTGPKTHIFAIPSGSTSFPNQGHPTRTIKLGSDNKLYVAVGSNCNSCLGFDKDMAVIKRMDLNGKNIETVARGLRNTVFFAEHPVTKEWWGNDMGQDNLGDTYPPDELNRLVMGRHYGWPYCVADKKPTPINPKPQECVTTTAPELNYAAHVAPLGIAFVPRAFSINEQNSALVAFHGSVVPSGRVGYVIQKVMFNIQGRPTGSEAYISGFLRGHGIVGRPVDMVFSQTGDLYLSDDFARLVYKINKK